MQTPSDDGHAVIVVGGGHAGCEAALAAARLGVRSLLITPNLDTIAAMPCNCSIGGPAKAHLVREIDALGGEMARNIDRTFTHIRILNASKGPAVQALRAQADKALYRAAMKAVIEREPLLDVCQDTVTAVLVQGGTVTGVRGLSGTSYPAHAVVIAIGTFLNGIIHIGEVQYPAGRAGEPPTTHLAASLTELGLRLRRFRTGTVPRVLARSVEPAEMLVQPSEVQPHRFSYDAVPRPAHSLLPCHGTATTTATHDLLRANAKRSSLGSGRITGIAPRYCPSIEAKLTRFPDRDSHLVFLEREGWNTEEVYVQGLSNSMPADVQLDMLHTVPGLKHCKMMRAGYAIEYDCIYSTQLAPSLAFPGVQGLYFAGQINGTSGYEEAAAQGFAAGLNAVRYCQHREPITFARKDGYIGVLLDDLTSRGLDEPYRLLTSRAEHRLSFGQDTASYRLLGLAAGIGLVSPPRIAEIQALTSRGAPATPATERQVALRGAQRPSASRAARHLSLASSYAPYIRQERARTRRIERLGHIALPQDVQYDHLPLRQEARARLAVARPRSIAEAGKLPGLTAADLLILQTIAAPSAGGPGLHDANEDPDECFT